MRHYVVRSVPAAGGDGFICAHVHASIAKAVACMLEPRAGVTKRVQRLVGVGDTWTEDLDAKEAAAVNAAVAEAVLREPLTGLSAVREGAARAGFKL